MITPNLYDAVLMPNDLSNRVHTQIRRSLCRRACLNERLREIHVSVVASLQEHHQLLGDLLSGLTNENPTVAPLLP